MNYKSFNNTLTFICLFMVSGLCLSGDFYRWTDAAGQIQLSDTFPGDDTVSPVDVISLGPFTDRDYPDHYSIVNQARKMEDIRVQREQLLLEKKINDFEVTRMRQESRALDQIEFFNKHGYGPLPYSPGFSDTYFYYY